MRTLLGPVCALALALTPVLAQEVKQFQVIPAFGGFGGGQLNLLQNKSVQEDLKMSDDQAAKVKDLVAKQQEVFKNLPKDREEFKKKIDELNKGNEKALADLLKPEQSKRLKQISLQQQGDRAFNGKEVAEGLKLTDGQKEKIKTIQQEAGQAMREIFKEAKGDIKEAQKKMAEHRKNTVEKIVGTLTDEQKKSWKEMAGEPFKGDLPGGIPLLRPAGVGGIRIEVKPADKP